jgi:propionate CoA-transferase
MLSLPTRPGPDIRPVRHWKAASPREAAGLVRSGTTIAVGWLGDALAAAVTDAFVDHGEPSDLTIVYSTTNGDGRNHGLNLLARQRLIRRVIGGQWHPVPGLQALAASNQIEAYSLPAGVILRLFRDIAEGFGGHLSRSGLGTSADPRQGGGRLNPRTQEELVRLVYPAGDETLRFRGFPIDVALIGVAFMEGTAAIAMTRESMTIARAARKCGGLVIAQMNRIGTLDKLPPGQVVVPDTLVDVLVSGDPRDRTWETFSPAATPREKHPRRLTDF